MRNRHSVSVFGRILFISSMEVKVYTEKTTHHSTTFEATYLPACQDRTGCDMIWVPSLHHLLN